MINSFEADVAAQVDRIFQEADPDIEVKVRMININYGHNREMLSMCRPLEEYAWFIANVRKNLADDKADTAPVGIDQAIDEMPKDFEIKNFIVANRAEVKDMCLTEYNEMETMEMLRLEGKQEGLQEGLQKGLQKGKREGLQEGWQNAMLLSIKNLMESMDLTADKVMDLLKIPLNQRTIFHTELSKNI